MWRAKTGAERQRWQTAVAMPLAPCGPLRQSAHMKTPAAPVVIPRWLPVDQAAAALGITARTLRYRAQHGRIERRRDGTAVLYLTPAVQPPGAP